MAGYSVFIKPSAGKEIDKLGSKQDRQRIIARIRALSENPRLHGSEKLAGYSDRYRLRQGNYRIVYSINDELREVVIVKVGHRKEIYKH